MKAEEIAQWVINNRYPKDENQKICDVEMYNFIIDELLKHIKEMKNIEKEITDEEIENWAKKVQPARGGFLTDYIFAAKWARNKCIK